MPKTNEHGLTNQQEAFAQACLEMTKSDAYRASYNCKNMTDRSIWTNACQLSSNTKVARRINELRQAVTDKVILDRAFVINGLMNNALQANESRDFTASNKAFELLGKVDELSMFVERANVESNNRHHHTAEPVSEFDEFLEEASGTPPEGSPENPLPN